MAWTWEKFRALLLWAVAVLIVLVTVIAASLVVYGLIDDAYRHAHQAAGGGGANEENQQANTEDLIAYYTLLLVVVTGFLALFTFGLFIYTAKLFRTASRDGERALKQAKDLFVTERRPWLQVSIEILSDMRISANGVEFDTRFTVTNVGLSPAFNVKLRPLTEVERERPIELMQRELAAGVRAKAPESGNTLFPNDVHKERYLATISKQVIDRERQAALRVNPDLAPGTKLFVGIHPFIYGTVCYQFEQGGNIHQTGFVYRLGMNEDERIPQAIFAEYPLTKDKFSLFRADCGFWAD